MDFPLGDDVLKQLQGFEAALGGLQDCLTSMEGVSARDFDSQLEPIERADAHLVRATALGVLLQMYLQTLGVCPDQKSAVGKEMSRLRQYGEKVEKLKLDKDLAAAKKLTSVNVSAANRFISHAIPDLSKEQKQALRQGSKPANASSPPSGKRKAEKDPAVAFLDELMADIGS